jgi:hypothetical protein
MGQPFLRSLRLVFLLAASALMTSLLAVPASALTPESPEVQQVVQRAAKFLASDQANDARIGARALAGLAFLKMGKPDHPRVAEAIKYIDAKLSEASGTGKLNWEIYSTGLALMFLVECDPTLYRTQIETIKDYLVSRQKPHGGWGYPERETGDTSMTQYGVLSSWEMAQVGIRVPFKTVEGVATWLLKTQDPSGAFGYQGRVSETFEPVKQSEIRPSMAAAGMASVYICYDLLGLGRASRKEEPGLPPAMKRVAPSGEDVWPRTKLDPGLFRKVMERGNAWMEANYATPDKVTRFTHYYLYALERYHSFRELAEGRPDPDPVWYNDGVRYLAATQEKEGCWPTSGGGATADTAFGILFLLRSTKKSIEKSRQYGNGTLVGGRGLPKYTDMVQVRDGQVVAVPQLETAERLLEALEKGGEALDASALEPLADLPPEQAKAVVSKYAKTLRDMAGSDSPQARAAALRTLARAGGIDQAPLLIYALNDSDPAVVREARDGLRRISRKLDGFGLPDEYTSEQLRDEIEHWKAWYKAIRPDADFEN